MSSHPHARSKGSKGPGSKPRGSSVFRASPEEARGARAARGGKGGARGGSRTEKEKQSSTTSKAATGSSGRGTPKELQGLEKLKQSMDAARSSGSERSKLLRGAKGPKGSERSRHRLTRWIPIGRGSKRAQDRADKGRRSGATPGAESGKKEPVSALTRRSRIPVALAAVFALVVLATNFPLTTLLSQHNELSAASSQLQQTEHANRLLADQDRQLNSTVAIDRLARQDYQMVGRGQTLYDVLPASGKSTATTLGEPISGDPGNQPLVEPSKAPDMSPDPGLAQASLAAPPSSISSGSSGATDANGATTSNRSGSGGSSAAGSAATSVHSSYWSRVANTLEFWK